MNIPEAARASDFNRGLRTWHVAMCRGVDSRTGALRELWQFVAVNPGGVGGLPSMCSVFRHRKRALEPAPGYRDIGARANLTEPVSMLS